MQFEHIIERTDIAVEKLQAQREHHAKLWETEFSEAHNALATYMVEMKEADAQVFQLRVGTRPSTLAILPTNAIHTG